VVRSLFVMLPLLFVLNAHASQDPTAPLGWLAPKEKPVTSTQKRATSYRLPTLQSIVCKSETPCYAILNDQVLSQGESIRGYRIKTIDPNYVSLQRNGKQWKLELFSLDIKKN